MRGASVFIFIGILAGWSSAQFLNNRPFPTYSLEEMPDTDFSCRDKILGGYYADPETQCQMFHVCVKVAGVGVQDFRFLCPNSTAFDQDHQICADWEDVDCDATTLYYSSDNFDLYRIGSGYESKAVKYGEDEEPFSLQRAETGDIRLNREHQTQRVNQQKEKNYKSRPNHPNQQQTSNRNQNYNNNNNNYNNNNNNNNNGEKDIFKSSSSSNFFNNRNGGKETDDEEEYDTRNVNVNQNEDRSQRRKVIRKQNRRPDYEEDPTERPGRPTGFANNFAGSSYIPTTSRPTTTTTVSNEQYSTAANIQRGRQRTRVSPQYNNADNFRQNSGRYNEDDGQYRENSRSGQYRDNNNSNAPQYTVSTPAPFRQTQQYNNNNNNNNYNNNNRQTTQYNSNNGQYNQYSSTTVAPRPTTRSTENYPSPFTQPQQKSTYDNNNQYKETENYPSTPFKQTQNYPSTASQKQTKETENYPSTPFKQTQNYPSTASQKETKEPENYSTTSALNNNNRNNQQQQYNNQYEVTKTKQTENYPTSNFNTQASKKPTTPFKQTDNYPTTFSPKTSPFKAASFSESYSTTLAPRSNAGYNQQGNQQSTQYNNNNKQSTQYTPSTNYNQQQYENTRSTNAQQSTYNQPQNSRQTTQYNPTTQQQKQTTQYTQYTPTVPRITTPYYSSTTPANNARRSNRFDETQYDDGSYNSRYEYDDNKANKDDEFLKTAHSTNIASSRNEYIQSTKNAAPVSTTQKPRPFSVTPNSPKATDYTKASVSVSPSTQNSPRPATNVNKSSPLPPPPPRSQPPPPPRSQPPRPQQPQQPQPAGNNGKGPQGGKKTKDASYDYAYYDTNVGSDHEYDIGVDIEKADKTKNKKQQ